MLEVAVLMLMPVIAPEVKYTPSGKLTPSVEWPKHSGVIVTARYDAIQDDVRIWVMLENGTVFKSWLSLSKIDVEKLKKQGCRCCPCGPCKPKRENDERSP